MLKAGGPFFTLLTASLNQGATLRRTLASVQRQRFQDLEHIVVDGGSSDRSVTVLKQFQNRYNLRWISEPDQGIADALNKGLARSSGQYILVLQADDYLVNPQVLGQTHSLLKQHASDMYSFPVIWEHPYKGPMLRKPIRLIWYNRFKFILPHQGCFVHRRVFDAIGGFNPDYQINLDYDFFYRAFRQGYPIQFGRFPVAVMGGIGIGSRSESAAQRLHEERQIQRSNERNRIWKLAQTLFRIGYTPYKRIRLKNRPAAFS